MFCKVQKNEVIHLDNGSFAMKLPLQHRNLLSFYFLILKFYLVEKFYMMFSIVKTCQLTKIINRLKFKEKYCTKNMLATIRNQFTNLARFNILIQMYYPTNEVML